MTTPTFKAPPKEHPCAARSTHRRRKRPLFFFFLDRSPETKCDGRRPDRDQPARLSTPSQGPHLRKRIIHCEVQDEKRLRPRRRRRQRRTYVLPAKISPASANTAMLPRRQPFLRHEKPSRSCHPRESAHHRQTPAPWWGHAAHSVTTGNIAGRAPSAN